MSVAATVKHTATTTKAQALLVHNSRFIPGGMASVNRRTDPPIAFARGEGAYLWDVDGKKYIDYHAGFAPYILGHNDPDLNAAVEETFARGLSNFGSGPTEQEGELAELFLQCVPTAERVQFLNSGSEATAQAIRVARAATGREHVILVQGSYNGNQNVVTANLMESAAQLGGKPAVGGEYPLRPITAGIPAAEAALLHAVEFNDLEAVDAVARKHKIAAMITEPVLQNIGVVKPREGYLTGLRQLADQHRFVLIFDEVKTGFRAALGGHQSICGVTPDLSTFGKAIANGFPIAALAGKAELLNLTISDDLSKRVLMAGTYNAHPVPVAASIACLRKLADPKQRVYEALDRLTARLVAGIEGAFARHGRRAVVVRQASAHSYYFMPSPPKNWWELVTGHDFPLDAQLRRGLIERGSYYFPTPTKQGSVSFAHCEADIDQTIAAFDEAVAALR
ncbi:MAG: aspartate aminotransferase family protein [Pirellulales bacterium]